MQNVRTSERCSFLRLMFESSQCWLSDSRTAVSANSFGIEVNSDVTSKETNPQRLPIQQSISWRNSRTLIQPDEIMVSFDVTSLFIYIPKELAETAVRESLSQLRDDSNADLQNEHLLAILKLCMKTFFAFQGQLEFLGFCILFVLARSKLLPHPRCVMP